MCHDDLDTYATVCVCFYTVDGSSENGEQKDDSLEEPSTQGILLLKIDILLLKIDLYIYLYDISRAYFFLQFEKGQSFVQH